MPIFLGIVGGVIAYFVLRHDDSRKAKNCLYLGIVLAVIGLGMNFLFAAQIGEIGQGLSVDVNT